MAALTCPMSLFHRVPVLGRGDLRSSGQRRASPWRCKTWASSSGSRHVPSAWEKGAPMGGGAGALRGEQSRGGDVFPGWKLWRKHVCGVSCEGAGGARGRVCRGLSGARGGVRQAAAWAGCWRGTMARGSAFRREQGSELAGPRPQGCASGEVAGAGGTGHVPAFPRVPSQHQQHRQEVSDPA